MKTLIAYYSRAGENYVGGQIRSLSVGNTKRAAQMLAKSTGADLFEIKQRIPYSDRYNECIAQAQADQRNDVRPALTALPENWDAYDEIYLGYPNYWNTMPMAVFTFLDSLDWTGKTIHPFCTNEGSGMGRSLTDLKRLCPQAAVTAGLSIYGSQIAHARSTIEAYVKQFNS